MPDHDVVILGAGPYGLAATAHLRKVPGLDVRIFGDPLSFWKRNMPAGMFLRSYWAASEISPPDDSLTLKAYEEKTRKKLPDHLPIQEFIAYGTWYQRAAVPDVDQRKIARVESGPSGFQIYLTNGERLTARRFVVAAGIAPFAWRPPEFASLPPARASHTSDHRNFRPFAGKEVLIVGCGQSGLESAALLHETGARVEMVGREQHIHWLFGWASRALHRGLGRWVRDFLYAPTDLGPAGLSQLVARPDVLRRCPRWLQTRAMKRCLRSAGAGWLVERLRSVPLHLGRTVTEVREAGEKVRIRLDDGTERTVDHVLLATGYHVDIRKYDFLAPQLLAAVHRNNGFPILREGMESSVPGLHFLGAPAIWSFGPLMLFISGTWYTCRALLRQIRPAAA
jgi:FAD-dependent urate hydroxylase